MSLTEQELAAIGDHLLGMDPEAQRRFVAGRSGEDIELLERALAVCAARGWRATPATMAEHLTGGTYKRWAFVDFLAHKANDAVEGRSPRQIWNIPARYGKSLLLWWTMVWLLDRRPGANSIYVSYGESLAVEGAVFVRDMLREHSGLLRTQLRLDRQRRDRFVTEQGGGLLAAGIDASVTGFGAGGGGGLFIDDPMKNWAEAHSAGRREHVWNQYRGTLRNRLDDEKAFVLVVHCVAAGEPVLTETGPRPIETVRPGDRVWALADSGMVLRRVLGIRDEGRDAILSVRTDRGALRVNARHPFLVMSRHAGHWAPRWVKAGDLAPKRDLLVRVAEVPNVGPVPIEGWDSDEAMWLLGYLFGDGWVNRRIRQNQQGRPTSWAVFCACGVRPMENERVAEGLGALYGRRPRFIEQHRYWRLDCNQAGRDLEQLGLMPGVGARDKRLPSWLFLAQPTRQRAFLRGLIDADGHKVAHGAVWGLASSSEQLTRDATTLAGLCGIRATAARAYRQTTRPPNSPLPINSVMWKARFAWDERRGGGTVRCEIPDGLRLDAVRDVTPDGESTVFDLAVDGEENFVAAGYVVHNTRWHEDDLSGRLLKGSEDETGEAWEVVSLPALAVDADPLGRAPGEPLEPDKFSLDEVLSRHRAMGSYLTAALEQQRPAPEEGSELLRAWFRLEEILPSGPDDSCTSWDLKLKDRESGDFVVGQAWWRSSGGFWCMEQLRGQWDHATAENAIALLAVRHPEIHRHVVEAAGSADEALPHLQAASPGYVVSDEVASKLGMTTAEREAVQNLRHRGMSGLLPNPPKGDKSVRARAWIAPVAEAGDVHLPASAAWVPHLLDELAGFPNATHDDQVDTMSQALMFLADGTSVASVSAPPPRASSRLGGPPVRGRSLAGMRPR